QTPERDGLIVTGIKFTWIKHHCIGQCKPAEGIFRVDEIIIFVPLGLLEICAPIAARGKFIVWINVDIIDRVGLLSFFGRFIFDPHIQVNMVIFPGAIYFYNQVIGAEIIIPFVLDRPIDAFAFGYDVVEVVWSTWL